LSSRLLVVHPICFCEVGASLRMDMVSKDLERKGLVLWPSLVQITWRNILMISDINIFLEESFRNFAIPITPNNLRSIKMSKGDEAIKVEHVEADTCLQFIESSDRMNVLPYVLLSHLLVDFEGPSHL